MQSKIITCLIKIKKKHIQAIKELLRFHKHQNLSVLQFLPTSIGKIHNYISIRILYNIFYMPNSFKIEQT